MRVRILGAGWYGCHLACALLGAGHDVTVQEAADTIFAGASGGNPARLHVGPHYPRSAKTRRACLAHADAFEAAYGHLVRSIPNNIYAVADHDSLMDFETYCRVLRDDIEFSVVKPHHYGLQNVEGAISVNERHVIIRYAREHFERALSGRIEYGVAYTADSERDASRYDLTIDCTFCANDGVGVDRFEPCLTVLLAGPTDFAATIMDGPFPSLYPWDEDRGLSSLTSARYTPLSKTCKTWQEARSLLDGLSCADLEGQAALMFDQMAVYYPAIFENYKIVGGRVSVRAQPRSGADARLCEMIQTGPRSVRIRAGKIDAIFHAEKLVKDFICSQFAVQTAA